MSIHIDIDYMNLSQLDPDNASIIPGVWIMTFLCIEQIGMSIPEVRCEFFMTPDITSTITQLELQLVLVAERDTQALSANVMPSVAMTMSLVKLKSIYWNPCCDRAPCGFLIFQML